jgi:hypothetical protein
MNVIRKGLVYRDLLMQEKELEVENRQYQLFLER